MTFHSQIDHGTPASGGEAVMLTIDGRVIVVPAGTSIMRAASENGTAIPKLCATDNLESFGSCRLCLVEVDGVRGTPASCTTPVAAGMIVRGTQKTVRNASTLAFDLGPVTAGERVERYGHMPAIVTSKDPDLLERILFEHGALVLRWHGPVPKELEESGAIVISDSGLEVPEEGALEFLEAAGILMRRNDFISGEGI